MFVGQQIESCKDEADTEPSALSIWQVGMIVTLWDMRRFFGDNFYEIAERLIGKSGSTVADDGVMPDDTRAIHTERLKGIRRDCTIVGLQMSALLAREIEDHFVNLSAPTYGQAKERLRELSDSIRREMSLRYYLVLDSDKTEFFTSKEPFGAQIALRFASASFDIEEAAKCFALTRGTACVMHLMRALEVALDAIGRGVGIPNVVVEAKQSWTTALRSIFNQIGVMDKAGDAAWLPKSQFFKDAQTHLLAVKVAWRDSSMHLDKKYTTEEAERIYNTVKTLVEHLAAHLDESGTFIP